MHDWLLSIAEVVLGFLIGYNFGNIIVKWVKGIF